MQNKSLPEIIVSLDIDVNTVQAYYCDYLRLMNMKNLVVEDVIIQKTTECRDCQSNLLNSNKSVFIERIYFYHNLSIGCPQCN